MHLLAALAVSGYLLTPTPIQPPRLASLPMMTLTSTEQSQPDSTTATPHPVTRQTPTRASASQHNRTGYAISAVRTGDFTPCQARTRQQQRR
ncbi:hypothetical protein [Paludibacterium denitrificans]|uniref:Uncharacterized protein n=1 Tax=Paludibacterium denitrificans TaxID=2675226 RepID=A0A844G9P8_9NEIS|nr:hypothetical protein [Paludibacterium denitrificans]MTD33156.1 hypothetical protein [Paludibacterium denitrificans]